MVFLVLAAQYESWSLPLAIILITPMALLFAILAVWGRGLENNLFTQIGMVTLIGLACKNAILIVEFARQLQDNGLTRFEAAREACRLRLRPILMTSLAFAFGVLPLMLADGAGAELRQAIGTATFWGTLGVTFFGLFLTPVFYVVIRRWTGEKSKASDFKNAPAAPAAGHGMAVLLAGLGLALGLSGCTVGPNYQTPKTATPAAYAHAEAAFPAEPIQTEWWRQFQDPTLTRLVQTALATNLDLRAATARVREARALRQHTTFDLYPTVRADGGYVRGTRSQDAAGGLPRNLREYELFDAGFDATWEMDLFGRVRRSVEAATAEVQGAEAYRQWVGMTVMAEVARNYFELRGTQQEYDVARRNAEVQRESLELIRARVAAGRGTDLDVRRAESQYESTLALLPALETTIKRAIHRLSVLTAQTPEALEAELSLPGALPAVPELVPVGNPADLLRRRPDIRMAERTLAAATARIGVATADLFPRVTWVGSVSLEANQLSGWAEAGADAYSFGPRISWAALDLGRVRARIKAAGARAEAELANYEKAVLTALEETENALVEVSRAREREQRLAAAARAAIEARTLAEQRYQAGVADYLTVLDAQRTQLAAESQLAQARTRLATALAALYKALGGGWETTLAALPGDTPSAPKGKAAGHGAPSSSTGVRGK
jgi:multidrug efflux system outer membrane protein